jgi:hypothetical protein
MADASDGYRTALVRRQVLRRLFFIISRDGRTAAINFFSISYPELPPIALG